MIWLFIWVIFRSWSFSKKMISNERPFKWYIIWLYLEKIFSLPTSYDVYFIFPVFWSHSVLIKIGQYTKSNLMIYNFSIVLAIVFVMTVNYDVSVNLVPRAILKKQTRQGMLLREIFSWFDSSILKQSKLIYEVMWIFHNGWFER